MARTVNRKPFSVPTTHTKSNFFTQAEFKGICDNKNDITVDQHTFADAKNIYVDDANVLKSRHPFKFSDEDTNIVEEWRFGSYGLRLYRTIEDTNFVFTIKCITHELSGDDWSWEIPVSTLGWDYMPKVTCTQIEDKIYIWFAGIDFIALNTTGLYFEDAVKYLYIPVKKSVINGIEYNLETKNFLTDFYRRRYQYSAVSSINFQTLIGKQFKVGLNGAMTEYLYDIEVVENQEKLLVYPYSPIGNNYSVDVVQTPRATVILRYNVILETIEVSFDGKSYRPLPVLENIVGTPVLTKDGLCVIAFTTSGVAKCKLVAQETLDFTVFSWTREPYMARALDEVTSDPIYVDEIDITFVPIGYFDTADNFTYIFKAKIDNKFYLYAEWLSGDDVIWAYSDITLLSEQLNDARVHFRYVAPTISYPDLGPVITILANSHIETGPYGDEIDPERFIMYFLTKDTVGPNAGKVDIIKNNILESIIIRTDDNYVYLSRGFGDADIKMQAPIIDTSEITYRCIASYNITGSMEWNAFIQYQVNDICMSNNQLYKCLSGSLGNEVTDTNYWTPIEGTADEIVQFDCIETITYKYVDDSYTQDATSYINSHSTSFKIADVANTILTDKYLLVDGAFIYLPENGMLEKVVDDTERNIASSDKLYLSLYDGYDYENVDIHKLTSDGIYLASGPIRSGDMISYTPNAKSEQDWLGPSGNRFIIEKIVPYNWDWIAEEGPIKKGDLIRLRAYDQDIVLPAGHVCGAQTIPKLEWPAAPAGWVQGDLWPTDWAWHPPITSTPQGEVDYWLPSEVNGGSGFGDLLPSGPVEIFGYVDIMKKIVALSVDSNGVWYSIDGTLWTSQLIDNNFLELDEVVRDGLELTNEVPDYCSVLNEYYFSFTADGYNFLEVTSDRRDESRLFSNKGLDLLLYLPERNEQRFANKITNLHPLGENVMGVFTDSEIWYIQTVALNDGSVAYTKPIKSKIPVGCRDGDSVITALDGQAIIFPTERGLTVMAPQDFIATTENTLTYLSDMIQEKYYKFYNTPIESSLLMGSSITAYDPIIKIVVYRYWVLVYRPMDREILAFDTRNKSWWSWKTPYPIRSLIGGARLYALLEIAYSPIESWGGVTEPAVSLLGRSFIWTDKDALPTTDYDIGYYDDVIDNTLNGDIVVDSHGNSIVEYASPIIEWYFKSQRLHFGAINNYKAIEGINTNLTGEETEITTKLSTKAYRDFYHPEVSVNSEIVINDIRTFVKRLNIMHVTNFEYKFENESTLEKHLQTQLKLNSLCIKYSVKEGVR